MTSHVNPSAVLVHILTAGVCMSAILFDEKHFQDYGEVRVSHIFSKYHNRSRRSLDEMPKEIHIKVTSLTHDVKLRLRRNILADGNLPVFTLNNGHCIRQNVPSLQVAALYQDYQIRAAMLVSRSYEFPEPFDLEGTMIINGSEFLLTPSRDLVQVTGRGRAHTLKRIVTRMNFGHDYLDERSPVVKSQRIARAKTRRTRRMQSQKKIRLQRQASVTHTVELTIIADFKIYDRFFKFTQGNRERALSEMKLYYVFMANLMDIRYRSVTTVDSSLIIRVALVSLVVTDVQAEAVWTERNKLSEGKVNAESALYSFRDWLKVNTNIPRADHWMLFTGYDLAEKSGTTTTIGIAFIGTLCTNSAVSVVEEYFTATSGAVSAHELGHSLDADHDGAYKDCSDDTSNVMSTIASFPREAVRASNPWKFSTCSVDAFGAYLDTVQCALRPPPKTMSTSEIGGLYLDADEQCELAMGPGSYFCRTIQVNLGLDLMCRRMYCYLPNDPGYCASMVPQEYTSCNNKMWCQYGLCVSNEHAPVTIDGCPQGDDKAYNCRNADCSQKTVREATCCRTCAERRGITLPVFPVTIPPFVSVSRTHDSFAGNMTTAPAVTPKPPALVVKTTAASTARTTRQQAATLKIIQTTATSLRPQTTPCLLCECKRRWSFYCIYLLRSLFGN